MNIDQADSVLNIDDDLEDFDINIPSQEESLGENWDPTLPENPPVTPESFEADPFVFDYIMSEVSSSEKEEYSHAVSEVELESEEEVFDDN